MGRVADVPGCESVASRGIIALAGCCLRGVGPMAAMWMAMLSLCLALAAEARGAQRVAREAVEAVDADAAMLQLARDPQAESSLRRDAVARVMDFGSKRSIDSLMTELKTSMEPSLRRALVQGLRASRQLPEGASQAILQIAHEIEASLLDDAAEVVGRNLDGKSLGHIAQLAAAPKTHPNRRLLATMAMGYQRTQESTAALMALIDNQDSPTIRTAAYASLARLTGIDDHGNDRDRWSAWWSQANAMNASQWQQHLLSNFARRAEALARQRAMLQERLITAMRQRYRAVGKEERESVLITMLSDPLDSVRGLSLELVREIVNSEPVGPLLIAALVTRLDDTSPLVRAGATLLLRDLKSAEAADIVSLRLANETERDRSVLRAYLLMMKRQPRLAAVGPAISLLADPAVRAEAAGTLLASMDHQPPLVGLEQSQRVAEFLRAQLAMEATPEPRFVELLGRVGNNQDFRQIVRWLDHEVDAVREAAARTWVASNRTLAPLAQRAGDPIIQAIVIPAATARGESGETLLALVEHRPKSEQLVGAWGRALVAMAPRVDPDSVVAANQKLIQSEDLSDLRLQLLSAAISPLLLRATAPGSEVGGGNVSERQFFTLQLIDLLLARADARLLAGDGKAATADLERVSQLKIDMPAAQQHRHDLIAIHARILSGELDEAFTHVDKYFTADLPDAQDQTTRSKVIDLLLHCADQCVTAKQTERAGLIASRLRARLIRPVPLPLETRVSAIEERIRQAAENP